MPLKWVEPEILLSYKGIKIYHCYKNDQYDSPFEYQYSADIEGSESKCECEFDIRDLGQPFEMGCDQKKMIRIAINEKILRLPEGLEYKHDKKTSKTNKRHNR